MPKNRKELDPKFLRLLFSRPIDFCKYSDDEAVTTFVDNLYSKMQADGTLYRGTYETENRAVLKGITLELFALRKAHKRMYLGYFRGQQEFLGQRQYLPTYMQSKDRFVRIVDWLEKLKYIANETGFYDREVFSGYRSRMRAKPKLIREMELFGITRTMIKQRQFGLIRLKDSEKKLIHFDETDETILMRQNVNRLNEFVGTCFIGLKIPNDRIHAYAEQRRRAIQNSLYQRGIGWDETKYRKLPVDLTRNVLYRVFNNSSFKSGGRFVGAWYQNIPSGWRKYIQIALPGDDEPKFVEEYDFSHLHPALLYARKGAHLASDAYSVGYNGEVSRAVVKQAMLRMLNAKNKNEAIGSLKRKFSIRELRKRGIASHEDVFSRLEGKHEPIRESFYSQVAVSLMYDESRIAEAVMFEMMDRHGRPALCVHDSFLVENGYGEILKEVMARKFEEIIGGSAPRIERDPNVLEAEADLLGWQRMETNGQERGSVGIEEQNTDGPTNLRGYNKHFDQWVGR